MARYGCYDALSRETQEARYREGIDPITYCWKCNRKLYIGAEVYTFEDDIYCDDCGEDYIKEHKREISMNDTED